jgi:large subunit ribosomal protein L4
MMNVPVLNKQGQEVETISVDEQALGGEVNHGLLKQAFVRYHANQRQGSARTKSRGMVAGSTRKLYRQKGTGRARMGQVRSNIRKGGGVAFAKTKEREHYRLEMPVKMRRKANRNALLAKLLDNEVKVIDDLSFDAPRTRAFEEVLKAAGVDRSCLVALDADNKIGRLSARNVEGVSLCPAHELTAFNLLNHRYLLIAKSSLLAWLEGPSAWTDKAAKANSVAGAKRKEAAA